MLTSLVKKKAAKKLVKAPSKPVKSTLLLLLCALGLFAFIKMLPELRRYIRIEIM